MGNTAQHYSVCNSKGFSEFHFYGYHLLLPSKSLCQRNGKYQVLYKCHPLIYRHLQQATHHNLQQDMLVAVTSPIFLRQIC